MRRRLFSLLSALLCFSASMMAQDTYEDSRQVWVYGILSSDWAKFYNNRELQRDEDKLRDTLRQFVNKSDYDITKTALEGGRVYSFRNTTQRAAFIRKVVNSDNSIDQSALLTLQGQVNDGGSDFYHWGSINRNGEVYGLDATEKETFGHAIRVPDGGCLLIVHESYPCNLTDQHFTTVDAVQRRITMYMSIIPTQTMKEIVKTEKGIEVPIKDVSVSRPGVKYFDWKLRLDSTESRPDSRITVLPVVREISEEEGAKAKFFMMLNPRGLDGEVFDKAQTRRMGYNKQVHDKVGKYIEKGRFMRAGVADSIVVKDSIARTRDGYHYPVDVWVEYRNHTGVYRRDTIHANNGRDIEPLFFFHPVSADQEEDIEKKRYEKEGEDVRHSTNESYQLFFPVGKAALESGTERGERGFSEIQKCAEYVKKIISEYELKRLHIVGYASPEGNEASNRDLASRRAQYFRDALIDADPRLRGRIDVGTPVVQPWTVVADTMKQMGYTEEAAQVYDICQRNSGNMAAQFGAIRQLPFYSTLIDFKSDNPDSLCVLDRMRVDDVTVDYEIYRALTPQEVVAKYYSNPDIYRKGGIGAHDYEYYHLLSHFENDPVALEPLAKVAYARFKDDFEKGEKNRPWTLAAYYLARCKYIKGEYDSTILDRRYIQLGRGFNPVQTFCFDPKYDKAKNWKNNPINDPGVVMMQIQILSKLRDYTKAQMLYANCYDSSKNPALGYYLECIVNPELCFQTEWIEKLSSTSTWNEMVINAFQHEGKNPKAKNCWKYALDMLESDTVTFPRTSAEVQYIWAMLRFKTEAKDQYDGAVIPQTAFIKGHTTINLDDKEIPDDWGAPMIEALRIAPALEKHLKWDDYFPDTYLPALQEFRKRQSQR